MYSPNPFKMNDKSRCHNFIEQFSFGVMVSNGLDASHLPFLLNREEGEQGVLYAHLSRANPQWRELEDRDALIIFQGPHGYISPSWYSSKPAVPTWNYAAVHAKGKVELLDDEATLALVENLTEKYEPALLDDSEVMSLELNRRLLRGIVGFKIAIASLQGTEKLGQNRKEQDILGIEQGLLASELQEALQLLAYMQQVRGD